MGDGRRCCRWISEQRCNTERDGVVGVFKPLEGAQSLVRNGIFVFKEVPGGRLLSGITPDGEDADGIGLARLLIGVVGEGSDDDEERLADGDGLVETERRGHDGCLVVGYLAGQDAGLAQHIAWFARGILTT